MARQGQYVVPNTDPSAYVNLSPTKPVQPTAFDRSGLGALAKAYAGQYATQQTNLAKAFPAMVQAKMVKPAAAGTEGNLQFAGRGWEVTNPAASLQDTYKNLQIAQLRDKREGKPTMQGAFAYMDDVMRDLQGAIWADPRLSKQYREDPEGFLEAKRKASLNTYFQIYGVTSPFKVDARGEQKKDYKTMDEQALKSLAMQGDTEAIEVAMSRGYSGRPSVTPK